MLIVLLQEEDANNNGELKGTIRIRDILAKDGVQVNETTYEITIVTHTKKIHLKAANLDDCTDWAQCLLSWVEQVNQV